MTGTRRFERPSDGIMGGGYGTRAAARDSGSVDWGRADTRRAGVLRICPGHRNRLVLLVVAR